MGQGHPRGVQGDHGPDDEGDDAIGRPAPEAVKTRTDTEAALFARGLLPLLYKSPGIFHFNRWREEAPDFVPFKRAGAIANSIYNH